jgi:hypothetical protein
MATIIGSPRLYSTKPSSNKAVFLFALLVVIACFALVSGCSTLQVASERDNSANFTTYRTYAWLPPNPKDTQNNIALRNENAVITPLVNAELSRRGLLLDTLQPDLLVRYHISSSSHTSYINEPMYHYTPGMYAYFGRGWFYSYPGSYYVTNRFERRVTQEGSLVIDVIDRRTNNVIWSGWSKEPIHRLGDLAKDAPEAIRRVFEQYPTSPVA